MELVFHEDINVQIVDGLHLYELSIGGDTMDRGKEENIIGFKCPHCGKTDNIFYCQPCGRKKLKCKDCGYLGYPKRFIRVN